MCGTAASEMFYEQGNNRFLQYGDGQGGRYINYISELQAIYCILYRMSIVTLICDPTAEVPQLEAHGDPNELTYVS